MASSVELTMKAQFDGLRYTGVNIFVLGPTPSAALRIRVYIDPVQLHLHAKIFVDLCAQPADDDGWMFVDDDGCRR